MRTFALIFILILTSTLYAQNNTIVLDGTVQDDKNRSISNATIIISSKNDSPTDYFCKAAMSTLRRFQHSFAAAPIAVLSLFVTVQSQAKFHKTGGKCLHF